MEICKSIHGRSNAIKTKYSNLVRSTLGMNCGKSISCTLNLSSLAPTLHKIIDRECKEKRPNPIRVQDVSMTARNRNQPNKVRNPCDLPRSVHIKKINTIIMSNTRLNYLTSESYYQYLLFVTKTAQKSARMNLLNYYYYLSLYIYG